MAAHGFNAVRTYTVPPRWVLDAAHRHGLWVMAGLWWPGHLAFLEDRGRARDIVASVGAAARACAGHPALLALSVGNEIPASLVRWYGARRVARYLERLYEAAKSADPEALVTYASYPSTEYLELPFLDFACFNVYLESRERLAAYLARLQNLAGDRPLVMGELGLDGLRNGEARQAASVAGQIRTSFEAGAAGAFVYSWTDQWYAGGQDMDDWGFGLTRRDRAPKPALVAVREALAETPFARDVACPSVSVVVCTYNGARTIRETLEGLARLDYPSYEVLVVDDGSTDATAAIASEYDVRLFRGPNRGLGHARNVGLTAARGEIVAYIDDDAWPDAHWLRYLVAGLLGSAHSAIGGPNLPPPGDGEVAACVANAPGGPVHVLVSDTEAEHIPGCNMAFRKAALEAIGGFDVRFRRAGDDVDVCWRLRAAGMTIGFSAAGVVWHRRRGSVMGYARQQRGYGEAESLLERKWPEQYNALGHARWQGRLYGGGVVDGWARRGRIYHGTWGGAPFQSVYGPARSWLAALPLLPEWYLAVATLAASALLGFVWAPLAGTLVPALIGVLLTVAVALRAAAVASLGRARGARRYRRWFLTAWLYLIQPAARLSGRLRGGLTPWRRRGTRALAWPRSTTWTAWTERRREPHEWLVDLEAAVRRQGCAVRRGGAWDPWDLEVRTGSCGAVRVLMAHEEHGRGRQLVRFRCRPRPGRSVSITAALAALALVAGAFGALLASGIIAIAALMLAWRGVVDCAAATAAVREACVLSAAPPDVVSVPAVASPAKEAA